MKISLKDAQTITSISELLYDFLPGSGNPAWKGHVTFKTVASKVGLADFYQPGSKQPMIATLLRRTLEERPDRFESVILEIVKAGLIYRRKQRNPITKNDISILNGILLDLGYKFPDLWNPGFLDSLDKDSFTLAQQRTVNETLQMYAPEKIKRYQELKDQFFELSRIENRQQAGRMLQNILNEMFFLSDLSPRDAFRVEGEEIDGSFWLDHETYLLEAKWEKEPLNEAPLLVFRGKIEGKSTVTRGVLLSINGYSKEAKNAIVKGKQPNFFAIDGYDLSKILCDEIELIEFLRARQRLLAEEGAIFVSVERIVS